MNAVLIRNSILIAIGLFFFINGLRSGNPGSIVIGAILAGIAFWVVFTGKVHKKFYKKFDPDKTNALGLEEDEVLMDLVRKVKSKLSGNKTENDDSSDV